MDCAEVFKMLKMQVDRSWGKREAAFFVHTLLVNTEACDSEYSMKDLRNAHISSLNDSIVPNLVVQLKGDAPDCMHKNEMTAMYEIAYRYRPWSKKECAASVSWWRRLLW